MEPGLFGMVQRMTGQPDIDQQIAQALGRAPGQPGGPPASPLNPPAPGPAGVGAPAAGGAAPAAAGGPAAAQAAPPQPQAYTTQPDLGQLYFQLARQEQAAQMFNQGLATFVASSSRSPDRNKYLSMGQVQPLDPGATFGNLMKIQQMQQQQQRLAGFQAAIPGLVKSMNLDPSYIPIMQNNPDLAQSLIQGHQPTGTFANWTIARDQNRNQTCPTGDSSCLAKADADFQAANPLVNALLPEGGGPAQAALTGLHLRAIDWQHRNPGEPLPDFFNNGPEGLAAHDAHVASLSASQQAAGGSFDSLNSNLIDMRQKAMDVIKAPNLANVLSLTPQQRFTIQKSNYVATLLPPELGGISQADLNLLKKLDALQSWNTGALKQANPHLTAAISPIETDLGDLSNTNVGPDLYVRNLKKGLLNDIDEARAQGIAATGDLSPALNEADNGDTNMLTRLPANAIAGGSQFLPDPKRVPPAELAKAKAAIAQGASRDLVVKGLKAQGFLPKPGEI